MWLMVLKSRVVQVGNSRAVVIPMAIAKELGWDLGTDLTLDVVDGEISLEKKKGKK